MFYTLDDSHVETTIRTWKFPGGEVGVDIQSESDFNEHVRDVHINTRLDSSDAILELLMATDAIRRVFVGARVHLRSAYMPYARQDRVCNAGEALSMKVMGSILNSQNYATVALVDPHSAVAVACIDRVVVSTQVDIFKPEYSDFDWEFKVLVAPDEGAAKKTEEFARQVRAAGVIYCSKTRNLTNGNILGMKILNPEVAIGADELIVLDDICDGGRTFIELARLMNGYPEFDDIPRTLMVTHGIFSKGVDVVAEYYDKIISTDSFTDGLKHDKLSVITLY